VIGELRAGIERLLVGVAGLGLRRGHVAAAAAPAREVARRSQPQQHRGHEAAPAAARTATTTVKRTS
jgi:hypothetical protein